MRDLGLYFLPLPTLRLTGYKKCKLGLTGPSQPERVFLKN